MNKKEKKKAAECLEKYILDLGFDLTETEQQEVLKTFAGNDDITKYNVTETGIVYKLDDITNEYVVIGDVDILDGQQTNKQTFI